RPQTTWLHRGRPPGGTAADHLAAPRQTTRRHPPQTTRRHGRRPPGGPGAAPPGGPVATPLGGTVDVGWRTGSWRCSCGMGVVGE
ncbi:hypothetical protein, partial [Rhizocola hellebori]|uniref:hypothetical protein n=1 Tax=Rhizocola hellebori TaxID=1392758 RepID=UPI00194530E8